MSACKREASRREQAARCLRLDHRRGAAGGGTGTLSFQGQTYPFEIAGLGGGGAGVSTIDASGEVYNLADVAQSPGAYDERRSGVAFDGAGSGDLWLENNAGVVMHLKAESEGLMLNLAADVVEIRMSQWSACLQRLEA